MHLYRTLTDVRADWRGSLVLCCGEGAALGGAPAAAVIAGAGALVLDEHPADIKAALKRGDLDFMVTTLDEALRTLKNEVRQKRPLSVGVTAGVEATLAEMVERGVQPEMHFIGSRGDVLRALPYPSLRPLMSRGMSTQLGQEIVEDDACWFPAADFTALRNVDEALLAVLTEDQIAQRHWVERISRYLRDARTGGRWIWLNEAQREAMQANGFTTA